MKYALLTGAGDGLGTDSVHLVKVLLKAAEQKNPKMNYRVKNSRLLGLIEFIPNILLDAIYKVLFRDRSKSF